VRRVSLLERRVTFALKIVLLIAVSAIVLAGIGDFIGRIQSVAIVLIGAVFFTYLIYPIVRRLHQRLPLIWSILIVYLGIALVVGFAISVVAPLIANEVQAFVKQYPRIISDAKALAYDPNNRLVTWLPQSARDYLASIPSELGMLGQRYAAQAASQALGLVLSAVGIVATIVVIPVISIYLMIEVPDLKSALIEFIPPTARPKTLAIIRDLDSVLGGFIRGQLLVGAVIGTAITLMLLVTHVRYAVLIGVAAGVLDIIPYVGAVVAFIPATTIAYFTDGWQHALLVAGLFVLIFQLEGHFISPRIVSESVGLTPLAVIIAVLIGAELGGIGGMFIAVPIAAALRVFILHAKPDYAAIAASATTDLDSEERAPREKRVHPAHR
jgi:predicted PurR-regulated permease PerM